MSVSERFVPLDVCPHGRLVFRMFCPTGPFILQDVLSLRTSDSPSASEFKCHVNVTILGRDVLACNIYVISSRNVGGFYVRAPELRAGYLSTFPLL
jgi:hypothetical protein